MCMLSATSNVSNYGQPLIFFPCALLLPFPVLYLVVDEIKPASE